MVVSVEPRLDGPTNMARDSALLERAEKGGAFARVYGWDGPWVSLGRHQKPERALVDPSCTRWVVRPTGGKAVLHGHDVTIGLAANLTDLGVSLESHRRISVVYRAVIAPIVAALNASGVPALLAEDTGYTRTGGHTADCFAHVAPNDVVDPESGRKVCGCALRLTESAVLLQASVPVGPPLVAPASVFDQPSGSCPLVGLDPGVLAQAIQTNWPVPAVQPVF